MTLRRERIVRIETARRRRCAAHLPGVTVEPLAAIIQAEADRPLRGRNYDPQHDGLFGDGHKQIDAFDWLALKGEING
jgi:hypothetical protein